jgi:hypothetical protein
MRRFTLINDDVLIITNLCKILEGAERGVSERNIFDCLARMGYGETKHKAVVPLHLINMKIDGYVFVTNDCPPIYHLTKKYWDMKGKIIRDVSP